MRYRPTGRPRRSRPLRRRDRPPCGLGPGHVLGPRLHPRRCPPPPPARARPGSRARPVGSRARAPPVPPAGAPAGCRRSWGARRPVCDRRPSGPPVPIRRHRPRPPLPPLTPRGRVGADSAPSLSSSNAAPDAATAGRAPAGRLRRRRAPEDAGRDAGPGAHRRPRRAGPSVAGPGLTADVSTPAESLEAASVPGARSPALAARPSGTLRREESTPSGALLTPGSVDAGADGGPVGSAAGDPALVSDMGTIPSRTAHDARSHTTAAPVGSAMRGSQREPSRSIH